MVLVLPAMTEPIKLRLDHLNSFFPYNKLFSLTFLRVAPTKPRWVHMKNSTTNSHHLNIVVIMGPTGSGKSRLSVDLATRFFPHAAEIINSDKIQVYRGLDITTNKITMPDRLGVPHHLLGVVDPSEPELTPSEFRSLAAATISDITSRRRLPLVVGGSNSFIYALLAKRFDSETDVFNKSDPVCTELRYNCCFLFVDVCLPVLTQYLSKRVDEMFDTGMLDELSEFYGSDEFHSVTRNGLMKAIGLPEFERYFQRYGCCTEVTGPEEDVTRRAEYEDAIRAIKDNTYQLAKRQIKKIQRLGDAGWDLRRIDATEAFRAAMGSDSGEASDIWERQVVEPSVKIVKRFLEEE